MFFRSRSTSAAKSTPGSRNWLMSLVKSKTGVSPTATFSVGLLAWDTGGVFSRFAVVGHGTLFSGFAVVPFAVVETVPFFIGLLSSDTVASFVGLLSLDMVFSLGWVECPRELVVAIHCGSIQINRQPFIGARAGDLVPFARRWAMGDAGVGWIAAIIIGGIAGWLAEQFMKSNMGLIMNIVLGIVGAAIASAISSYFGIVLGDGFGYLIYGFIGAALLIWIVRAIRPA